MLQKAISLLTELANRKFWGKVILKFEGGKVTHVLQEESIKLETL